ncbi:MAG: Gfo/Idh/MocA family oxidoreductase [Planctomycetes bacterium]|nr:Gfo/Idh/MocA family oxidoreductase [Planctomycetota bacterium]
MTDLKIGFVGGGFIARFHLRALESVRGVRVEALHSRTPPEALAAEARSRGLGPAHLCSSIEELAAHVDVVALLGPNATRLDALRRVIAARDAGAPVRAVACEKPLGRNLIEARAMHAEAHGAGIVHAYFENQLHLKALLAARAQLAALEQRCGPPLLARAAEEHAGPHAAWFWDPRQQGGGVLSDMGCHSIALAWALLSPASGDPLALVPVSVQCELALLKWGREPHRGALRERFGIDYAQTPAEDYASGTIRFRDPRSKALSLGQFSTSWMNDKQGLKLEFEALGAGYACSFSSLRSPAEVFVADAAASALADQELALEKATTSRGTLPLQPNEPDLYGYVDEWQDLVQALASGREPRLSFRHGCEIARLVMACYLSAERGERIDLEDPLTAAALESYIPAIQRGLGAAQLLPQARR